MTPNNYHTHTCYCDGKDSPAELVHAASALGCAELGFSGHSFVPFDDCCMSPEATRAYQREIRALKEEYAGQIRLYLGVEQDYYSPASTEGYDYVIGSVHYVYRDGAYLPVDLSRAAQERIVREHFAGDFFAFAEAYYLLVGQLYEKTHCGIVGHFDLITKFNEGGCLFDTQHPRYRAAALAALDRLCASPVTFEVNTGAISRGYRSLPYPEPWLLTELRSRGVPLILSSDCHDKRSLLFGLREWRVKMPEARERLFD